jgi:hypothetical protein
MVLHNSIRDITLRRDKDSKKYDKMKTTRMFVLMNKLVHHIFILYFFLFVKWNVSVP